MRRFEVSVIANHKKRSQITAAYDRLDTAALDQAIKDLGFTVSDILIATQDDEVGPSDLVLVGEKGRLLGLSVKYKNSCSFNVSGRHFLEERSVNFLKEELNSACLNYIDEMKRKYGNAKNWFRTRKRSVNTDMYIELVRNAVLDDWVNKSEGERAKLMSMLGHSSSPIDFWVVEIKPKMTRLILDIDQKPINEESFDQLELRRFKSCFVIFSTSKRSFAKMQIKFNDGILERVNANQTADYVVDGIPMKTGDPINSWNFNTLKIN